MDSRKKLLQNSVIVERILQYLTLGEQIQCSALCKNFHEIITKRLWVKQYRHLSIHKSPNIAIICNSPKPDEVSDKIVEAKEEELQNLLEFKIPLSYDKLKDFLKKIATYVEHLNLCSEYFTFQKNLGVAFCNVHMFTNLCSLTFNNIVVTNDQLALLATNCRNLSKLKFIECQCDELESLVPGYNLDIRQLSQMVQLRELVVQSDTPPSGRPELEEDVLHEMINKLNLSTLILRNIRIVSKCSGLVPLNNGCCMAHLNVGNISHEYWPNFKHQLGGYGNLVSLTINTVDTNIRLNSVVFQVLSFNCYKLQKLVLEHCHLHVDDCSVIKTLEHLSLFSCNGFNATNLQQILGHRPLKSLHLIQTPIVGVIEDLNIASSSLEDITIDAAYIGNIEKVFCDSIQCMSKVHTIKWLNKDLENDWILSKCPSLRRLHICNPFTIRRFILKMDALQHLTFTRWHGLTWPFFLILLKNLPLQSLNIFTEEEIELDNEEMTCASTTLRRILIPFRIFRAKQHFWLDLVTYNPQLRLAVYGEESEIMHVSFLKNLLKWPHITDNINHMKICGMRMGK